MALRRALLLLAAALSVLHCAARLPPAPHDATILRPDVYVQAIVPGVWRHVSYWNSPELGQVPSNGLMVEGALGAVIIDTAWSPEQTAAVLDWTESHLGSVHSVVVTHSHADRLGGLSEVRRRGIPSYALVETVRLAEGAGWPPIDHGVVSGFSLESLGVAGELFHPGAAHTIDNATVWLPGTRILAGGCLVRSSAATSMGNTSEADVDNWPGAVGALQKRYPEVRIVVPGHGDLGGPELLEHTRELLKRMAES